MLLAVQSTPVRGSALELSREDLETVENVVHAVDAVTAITPVRGAINEIPILGLYTGFE